MGIASLYPSYQDYQDGPLSPVLDEGELTGQEQSGKPQTLAFLAKMAIFILPFQP
jgi:hypothetical protein